MTELGNRLKEARLAKDMSLDDLQIITKIQKRYLIGIEEGNYGMMPGKFYVRAFIKQYAEAVGLEYEELFEQFKNEIPTSVNDDIPEKLSRVQSRKDLSGGNPRVFDVLSKVLVAVFIIGAIAVLYYFIEKSAGNKANNPVDENENPVVNVEDNLAETEAEKSAKDENQEDENSGTDDNNQTEEGTSPETDGSDPNNDQDSENNTTLEQEVAVIESGGSDTVYELKNAQKFDLKLVTSGETWVNIKNGGGESFYQGMLSASGTASQNVDFTNEAEAVLVIGNTAQTEIYVNEKKIEYAIAPTQSVKQDITIRFVKSNE